MLDAEKRTKVRPPWKKQSPASCSASIGVLADTFCCLAGEPHASLAHYASRTNYKYGAGTKSDLEPRISPSDSANNGSSNDLSCVIYSDSAHEFYEQWRY
jgi:hypothetical protein